MFQFIKGFPSIEEIIQNKDFPLNNDKFYKIAKDKYITAFIVLLLIECVKKQNSLEHEKELKKQLQLMAFGISPARDLYPYLNSNLSAQFGISLDFTSYSILLAFEYKALLEESVSLKIIRTTLAETFKDRRNSKLLTLVASAILASKISSNPPQIYNLIKCIDEWIFAKLYENNLLQCLVTPIGYIEECINTNRICFKKGTAPTTQNIVLPVYTTKEGLINNSKLAIDIFCTFKVFPNDLLYVTNVSLKSFSELLTVLNLDAEKDGKQNNEQDNYSGYETVGGSDEVPF